ncbi:hypothetical protein PHYSODRAFT_286181 [Phytophthora sojae]|uniref:RxLR effector protein n=3 Tax=Phytophthora sojae TaxID=67593 RepID=G4ZM86_PHYSP|nr:hypothetical protein PHYSODRAFT_286181 [Phytophthora sojae]EGZ14619.1 hypothetical protein PHYSODRAFT_286181 [Phytophthora sojae]|eukprot:XP_009528368.1 hypothetical protein PHYSODRAFT_286181 [Phytophthora sojae]
MNLVVLATVLLASGTAVSYADQASVLNVDVVHSSRVLSGEDKRFLRSHQTTGDEGKITKHDDEERVSGENLFGALKVLKMGRDVNYRDKVFQRWKNYGHTKKSVLEKGVPDSLVGAYKSYLKLRKNTGKVFGDHRPRHIIEPR